jgi:hypothetical protein
MVYVDSYDKVLYLRTADGLWGPYSAPQKVARVPHEPSSELIYLGFEHPKFRADDGAKIYISYCQPHFYPNAVVQLRFR